MAYNVIWEFQVPQEKIEDFEAAYGSHGIWASLFAKADGFIRLELLHCTEEKGRYLTIDRWASQRAFDTFKADFAADYNSLDERFKGITASEKHIGAFYT